MKNKKIKIVHIIPTLSFGGAERFVIDLVNNSDESKFEHTIIIFKQRDGLADQLKADCRIILVPKKGKLSFSLFRELKKELKKQKPDIVHTNLFGANFWGRVVAHSLGIPVVTTEHGVNLNEPWFKNVLLRFLKNYSSVYISPSQATAGYMRRVYKITKDIKIINHGIGVDKFSIVSKLNKTVKYKILILGRLDLTKGQDIALKALSELKNYNWQLEIVGEGEDKNKIEKLIIDLNLQDRVNILPPTKDVVGVLQRNQIVLVPSRLEAFGLTAVEAMSAGRIVIASNAGGLAEVVKDGKTGFVAKAGDVNDFAKKIKFVFENFDKSIAIANNAQRLAVKEFSIKNMVEKYENIYQNLKSSS